VRRGADGARRPPPGARRCAFRAGRVVEGDHAPRRSVRVTKDPGRSDSTAGGEERLQAGGDAEDDVAPARLQRVPQGTATLRPPHGLQGDPELLRQQPPERVLEPAPPPDRRRGGLSGSAQTRRGRQEGGRSRRASGRAKT
jgi:hypothetical protein